MNVTIDFYEITYYNSGAIKGVNILDITARLKELILSRYKSLRAFAEVAGIQYTTLVSMLQKDLDRAGMGTTIKVCKCLGISADWLGEGEIVANKQLKLSPDEVEMIERYRALDERSQRVIRNLVKVEYEETTAAEELLSEDTQQPKNQK